MNMVRVLSLSFIALIVIFAIVSRPKKQSAADFQNMSRSAGMWLIAGTYTATLVSAVGMVGLPGTSYAKGVLIGILNWGSTIGILITALFFGPRLRRFGAVTLGEFFESRFNSKSLRLISAIVVIVGVGAYFVSQTIGSAVVLEQLLQIPYNYTVVLSIAIIMIITLLGGARSVTVIDTVMFAIIALGLGLIFAPSVIAAVGLDKISQFAITKPDYFSWNGGGQYPFGTILGWITLWALGIAANPVNVTRAYLAKNDRVWMKGLMLGFAVTMSLIWLTHVAASAVYVVNPTLSNPSSALPWAALNLVPPVVGMFATVGLTSACISTANTQLLVVAQSLITDLYERINKDITPERGVFLTRAAVVLLGLIGLVLTLGRPTLIVTVGNFGSSVFAAAFFPVLAFGLYCRWITKEGAFASMLAGILFDLGLHAYPAMFLGKAWGWAGYLPYSIHPVIWSTIVSAIVVVVVSLLTKPDDVQLANFEVAATSLEQDMGTDTVSSVVKGAYGLLMFGIVTLITLLWFASLV